jgi:hypothetical protein
VAAALPYAVAPVGAPSLYSCGGAEERRGCDGNAAATFAHAVAPVGAPSAAAAGFNGEWRAYSKSCCCAEQRRFRKDQKTRRDSVASRATFDNWRLAAEQGLQMAWSVTTDVVSLRVLCGRRGFGLQLLKPTTQRLGNNSFESSCCIAAFVVSSEPHTGARPSVRLCAGPSFLAVFIFSGRFDNSEEEDGGPGG